MTRPVGARGIPSPRTWSRVEVLLAGILLVLAAVSWLLTNSLAMPDMRAGILTGLQPMRLQPLVSVSGLGLFLGTWTVMMAAMMLPGIAPFTVGISRLMGARAGHGILPMLTMGYLLVWGAAGVFGYLVARGFDALAVGGGATGVRAGAAVLLAAGTYQFTPLKRWCLVRCRSPLALVVRYADLAARSRPGALLVGARHGGYCLGCCWALMVVLLAAGMMSLVWMAVIAAVITVEKVLPRGEMFGHVVGVLLAGLGAVLLIAPGLVMV
ncbi:putative metal-binding membrane protein [Halopolyspora algeriensis]|uniref:Putative metal-binding membrane protein n=1 Tax=Halopolyspora algeriensis TaxID=1500506 RepID=A0A368VJF3_9ACTN|nr:DUF2182 domain-containing protein [Halopolyspora algeriensis]RCW39774.1 putative metal-binding membrane protein [Halopolyspora algeriensis]TQM56429.1 putative metal-binding membrane protein [Halopolyspora algeriensis]